MKLAFGILSSREDPSAVVQLVDALGPDARVFVHHDLSKRAAPRLEQFNVHLVDDPVRTDWGEWSLCEAVVRLLRTAAADPDWDYFQLLSATCLPIKPIDAFARFVAASPAEVHMDQVVLDEDPVALMSHGFRAFAPVDTFGHRVLRRLRRWYLGPDETSIDRQGLGFSVPSPGHEARAGARVALGGMRWAMHGAPVLSHPFGPELRCHLGSTWWGARREACEFVARQPDDGELQRFFKRVLVPDEFYFHTLLGNAGYAIGESNHLISRFDDAHPVRLDLPDLPVLERSPRFFARKFPDDADAPIRHAVLDTLVGAQPPRNRSISANCSGVFSAGA